MKLIIFSEYPNKTQHYLTDLFDRLLIEDEDIRFFAFRINNSTKSTIGSILKKQRHWYILYSWFAFIKAIIYQSKKIKSIRSEFAKNGKSFPELIKYIFNYSEILTYDFSLIYFVSVNLLPHFESMSLFGNAKFIASSRGQDFDFKSQKIIHSIHKLDRLHVLGEYLKIKAIENGFPEKKIVVIHPSGGEIDFTESIGTGKTQGKIIIGTAARLHWIKGHVFILRALKHLALKETNFEYRIYGDGPEYDFIKCETERLGLTKYVSFYGWLNPKDLSNELSHLDIYLMTPLSEGFNNSVIIAQKMGIPCIVSNVGGLPENINYGKNGLIVPKYSIDELALKLINIVSNKSLREEIGKKAKDFAETQYSFKLQLTKYKELLN